jgi:hypothetical protein
MWQRKTGKWGGVYTGMERAPFMKIQKSNQKERWGIQSFCKMAFNRQYNGESRGKKWNCLLKTNETRYCLSLALKCPSNALDVLGPWWLGRPWNPGRPLVTSLLDAVHLRPSRPCPDNRSSSTALCSMSLEFQGHWNSTCLSWILLCFWSFLRETLQNSANSKRNPMPISAEMRIKPKVDRPKMVGIK